MRIGFFFGWEPRYVNQIQDIGREASGVDADIATREARPAGGSRATSSRLWFLVHGWVALPIWGFLLFVCVTGTICVLAYEFTWLVNPASRAGNGGGQAPMPFVEAVPLVESQVDGAKVRFITQREPYLAYHVGIAIPGYEFATAYVNPYTGMVQEVVTGRTFRQFIRALHGWLLMPFTNGHSLGWWAVSLLSIPLIASVVTGLVVYKRFWRAYTRPTLRTGRGARTLFGDLHRLIGAWSFWFVIVIALTGMWFLTLAALGDFTSIKPFPQAPFVERADMPIVPLGRDVPVGWGGPEAAIDRAVAAGLKALPDSKIRGLVLPNTAFNPVQIFTDGRIPLMFERAWINPYTAKVIKTARVGELTALQTLAVIAPPLHYGTFAGLISKLIWFVFGAAMTAMVATGFVIWSKRTAEATVGMVRDRRLALAAE